MPADAPTTSAGETVQVICPSLPCRRVLWVPIGLRGKLVTCASCKTTLRVPEGKGKK